MDDVQDGPKAEIVSTYGLQQHVLSPMETLAQSMSLIAPSTTPALTVPLVFALSGAGSALAYGIATAAMVLVALCIASFARESASPGSLYSYAKESLPPAFGALTAWALFFAYVMTASSVLGGFLNFAYILMARLPGNMAAHVRPSLLAGLVTVVAVAAAYRDIRISTRMMMMTEFVSMFLIAAVIAVVLWNHGMHLDASQFRVRGFSKQGVRTGSMLAIFSFVGFESATSLGAEARHPLTMIPRAVIWSTVLVGVFFLVAVYGEVLGFHTSPVSLADSAAPFHFLSEQAGIVFAGWLIDVGVLVSMFAATLACVIAASRVLLLMAHHGLAHSRMRGIHAKSETPGAASVVTALLAFLPVAVLVHRGVSGADVYGWMGTLAVFGFLTAYLLAVAALIAHRRKQARVSAGQMAIAIAAALAMMAALLGNLFPVPPTPYRYFPYVYAVYMAAAMGWYAVSRKRPDSATR